MSGGECRVLIVEDELLVATDLQSILQENGYIVVGIARSGEEAIEIIRKKPIVDLIVMDFRLLGELNGEEVASAIESHFNRGIPVIFMSGSAMEIGRGLSSDSRTFLPKPLDPKNLLHCLKVVLGK